ncbi:hypothetical protein ACSTDX_22095, partial [Vibrio vulnificus]
MNHQPNKQFNSDSQRLALSLRVELSVYGAVLKFSVCAAHTLIGRYVAARFGGLVIRESIRFWALEYFAHHACPDSFSMTSEKAK